jgi:hypothetical protein
MLRITHCPLWAFFISRFLLLNNRGQDRTLGGRSQGVRRAGEKGFHRCVGYSPRMGLNTVLGFEILGGFKTTIDLPILTVLPEAIPSGDELSVPLGCIPTIALRV